MKISNFLKSLKRIIRKRPGSVIEVLATMLPPDQLEQVILSSKTQGHLTEVASKAMGIDEDSLIAELAHELGVGYLSEVAPIDLDTLPSDRAFSQYRRAISIPMFSASGNSVLIVSDPFRARGLVKEGEGTLLTLAKAANIITALDQSERLFRVKQEEARRREQKELNDLAEQALEDVVSEGLKYESATVQIVFPRSGVSYTFKTADGREGTGSISDELREPIANILNTVSESKLVLFGKEYRLEQRQADKEYLVYLVDEPVAKAVPNFKENVVQVAFTQHEQTTIQKPSPVENLPMAKESLVRATRPGSEQVVLVVDDNATFASVLERFLGRQGLKVVIAENGEVALELLRTGRIQPAAIVSDLHMPRLNGAGMLKEIRTLPDFDNVPVIMLTSDNEAETEIALLDSGADAFVAKNEDPRILCAHVKRLVARNSDRRVA